MKITRQDFIKLKEADDLEKALAERGIEVEDGKWPQDGDQYWFVHSHGSLGMIEWVDDASDWFHQSLGNVHRTEADAERYKNTTLRRWQAEIAIRRWRDEHCPFTPDWTSGHPSKWYRYYNHGGQIWAPSDLHRVQHPQIIYFATSTDVQACAAALPDEWNALLID